MSGGHACFVRFGEEVCKFLGLWQGTCQLLYESKLIFTSSLKSNFEMTHSVHIHKQSLTYGKRCLFRGNVIPS